ncbi:ROK family protein [Candidatus Nitrosacidococcus tergens]|uniref:Mannofructokinase n=1 Tax=Candidatus Nitrosacidococcus tergens TaxID=553981 RepID=A0A7G1Q7R1_9GAMM|nr:ROK family protein [Candidatus Nitrosacidococcus tergens]CAB1274487.1 Mannofructokinase [Candidatus Nitrosacidococcus tergens]
MIRLGVDLGGTKIELIALDDSGAVLLRRRKPTPQGEYQATLKAICSLILETELELRQQGTVGIGTPGALSLATGRIKNANSTCLNGQPLQQDLEKLLQRSIRLENDANCLALSEATDGAAAGAAVVFGVIIGTGTGGGIVINGKILTGANAIAGEWGHNPLPWSHREEFTHPPDCYCGKKGCIETWLSGPGLARDYQSVSGKIFNPKEIDLKASQGDQICEVVLQLYEDRLARSLAHIINILDPNVIVLGGGLSNLQRLYRNVPKQWKNYVFSDEINTQLVPPLYGDSSGVRGAAWLWNIK